MPGEVELSQLAGGPAEPVPPLGVGRGLQRLGSRASTRARSALSAPPRTARAPSPILRADSAARRYSPRASSGSPRPSWPRPGPAAGRSARPRRARPGGRGPAGPAGSGRRPPHRRAPSWPGRRPAGCRRPPGRPGRGGPPGRVVGQLGQVALEVVAAQLDQGRAHPVVEAAPLPGGELLVQGLVDEGVGEPEAARATTSRSKSRPCTEAAARLALAASDSRLSRRPITCRIPSGTPASRSPPASRRCSAASRRTSSLTK